jgi:hypothetical protein
MYMSNGMKSIFDMVWELDLFKAFSYAIFEKVPIGSLHHGHVLNLHELKSHQSAQDKMPPIMEL